MQRRLYSGHLSIADVIFRSQFKLSPRTNFFIVDTPNNRSYKIFFVRNLYTFYFRQCFTDSFKFSSIFYILFFSQFNGLFRSIKMEILSDFQSVFISMVDAFPSCKDLQSTMGQGQKHGYKHGVILWHMVNNFFFTVRINANHTNSILVHFVDLPFRPLQILANKWLPNYYINLIFPNIMSLGPFLFPSPAY